MQSYERQIMRMLPGETPREKYCHLRDMKLLLQQIAYPRRGEPEEEWTAFDMAEKAQNFVTKDEEL